MFVNLYTALTYGIYYSFFEVFPLVYPEIYGFNVGETAIVFTAIVVGCVAGIATHFTYLSKYLIPDILKNGLRAQEHRLVPAIFASFGPPIGLFIFGWTARASVHWFVSIIGIFIYAYSCFILLQCIFSKLPHEYGSFIGTNTLQHMYQCPTRSTQPPSSQEMTSHALSLPSVLCSSPDQCIYTLEWQKESPC